MEFFGSANQIRVQKRLRDRQPWIATTPAVSNGGRILHFVEPDRLGWNRVAELANEDRLAGFPCVIRDEVVGAIRARLGPHWRILSWNAFLGPADRVRPVCERLIETVDLPAGWRIEVLERPDEDRIAAIQALNAATGVSPYPAYYSRGEAVPIVTVCISDGSGELAATASAAQRYHPESRLAGHVFAGMVSVSPAHRRQGLGRLANAVALVESHARFGWTMAKEHVAADNAASQAMVEACGLGNGEGRVSLVALDSDEGFTR